MKRLLALLLSVVMTTACGPTGVNKPYHDAAGGVVSLDYCADQFVLKFVPRENILALSPDATRYFSYQRQAAAGVPSVLPRAENLLSLKPTTVVRSYGGGPMISQFLNTAGIHVVQLGYPNDIESVKANIISVASQLGASKAGREVVLEMERRQQKAMPSSHAYSTLYVTPGGVTTGTGSLVHNAMTEAGLKNYESRFGWHDVPLERLVYQQPDLIAMASFGDQSTHVDPWTLARHPLLQDLLENLPKAQLEGAWTSCGAWFLMDAVEALSHMSATMDANGQ